MDGKVALVTGAGRGIGLGIARALAAAGCAVAIQDIDEAVAKQAVDSINAAGGGRAIALGGDINDASLPARLVEQAVAQLGGLHVLVNNASIQHNKHWLDLSADELLNELRADLVSPILCCQQAVPIFKRQRWGRVINIGSIQGRHGNPWMLPYSLSKAAFVQLTMGLARELAPHNVTVNLLAPGWFDTFRNKKDFETDDDLKEKGKGVPLGRIGEPRDCAGAALLLCSEAGSYITGQTLYVDGGMSAR